MAANEVIEEIACPVCGSTSWEATEDYSETLRLRIHTHAEQPIWATEKSMWYSCQDSSNWECENGHAATDAAEERLSELRSDLDFIQ